MSAESVKDSLGRWAFGASIAPEAFNHPLWKSTFAALKAAPLPMAAPGRKKMSSFVMDRLDEQDESDVVLMMNDPKIRMYGWSASTDSATVHHEPVTAYSGLLPTEQKPVLLKFANSSTARKRLRILKATARSETTRKGLKLKRKALKRTATSTKRKAPREKAVKRAAVKRTTTTRIKSTPLFESARSTWLVPSSLWLASLCLSYKEAED